MVVYPHHSSAARARHEDRLARSLAAFAPRGHEEPSPRTARVHCPLSVLASWIVSRRVAQHDAHAAVEV
jgi:hypothetical protein